MFRKILLLAVTTGLASKLYRNYRLRQEGAVSPDVVNRDATPA